MNWFHNAVNLIANFQDNWTNIMRSMAQNVSQVNGGGGGGKDGGGKAHWLVHKIVNNYKSFESRHAKSWNPTRIIFHTRFNERQIYLSIPKN